MGKKDEGRRLTVIVTKSLRNKFMLKCKKQNADMSKITRSLIENYLKKGETK